MPLWNAWAEGAFPSPIDVGISLATDRQDAAAAVKSRSSRDTACTR